MYGELCEDNAYWFQVQLRGKISSLACLCFSSHLFTRMYSIFKESIISIASYIAKYENV